MDGRMEIYDGPWNPQKRRKYADFEERELTCETRVDQKEKKKKDKDSIEEGQEANRASREATPFKGNVRWANRSHHIK